MANAKSKISAAQRDELLLILQSRFEKNMSRHKSIKWADVLTRLKANADKHWSLFKMEETGGEPDVVGVDKRTGAYIFYDCSPESPKGRRSICYDHEALEKRKAHKPENSAINMAEEMGIEILTEEQYMSLQALGAFDSKTSSWLKTPASIRKLGGAIHGDFRYGRTFIGYNGADSYYGVRGFRGMLLV